MNEQIAATNPGSQTEAIPLRANSRRFDPFVRRFYRLAAAWKTETGHLSNLTEKCDHAAYRSIVEMGPEVIPLILAELENEPDYWFAALCELTGENPVPPAARGILKQMANSWLDWAEKHGFTREQTGCVEDIQHARFSRIGRSRVWAGGSFSQTPRNNPLNSLAGRPPQISQVIPLLDEWLGRRRESFHARDNT